MKRKSDHCSPIVYLIYTSLMEKYHGANLPACFEPDFSTLDFPEPNASVTWRLDRLGRSLKHLIETINQPRERSVEFKSLLESIGTTKNGSKLIFHIFAALAVFETNLIQERTLASLAAAQVRGRTGGRARALDEEKTELTYRLYDKRCPPLRRSARYWAYPRRPSMITWPREYRPRQKSQGMMGTDRPV